MATQILPVATGAADSTDQVLAAAAVISLMDADDGYINGNSIVAIYLKAQNGTYVRQGTLNKSVPAIVIEGAGTYRFSRLAGSGSCGVFLV